MFVDFERGEGCRWRAARLNVRRVRVQVYSMMGVVDGSHDSSLGGRCVAEVVTWAMQGSRFAREDAKHARLGRKHQEEQVPREVKIEGCRVAWRSFKQRHAVFKRGTSRKQCLGSTHVNLYASETESSPFLEPVRSVRCEARASETLQCTARAARRWVWAV